MTRPRKVLVTGVTGFVGGELLRRLLERDRRRLVCMVRAGDDGAAGARGESLLRELLGAEGARAARDRVEWVRGDLECVDLGMTFPTRRRLTAELGEIYHCAASTRFDLPLADSERINVGGVAAMHDLAVEAAARGPFRRLHHVSTAFVAGRRRGLTGAEHLPPDDERRFRNTYERTKARAERLLGRARVPVTCYRPSIIVGDSRNGRTTSWNVVYFPMRLMATGNLPLAPRGGRALLDCVPIDFVADGILALGGRDDTVGGTFHLTAGEHALGVRDVVRQTYAGIARRAGRAVRVGTTTLRPLPWWVVERVFGLVARGKAREVAARFRPYVPYTRVDTVFDNRREARLLAAEGIATPRPAEFFPRVVDYALAHDFGRRRREPAQVAPTCGALGLAAEEAGA